MLGKDQSGKDIPGITVDPDLANEDISVILLPYQPESARRIFTRVNRYARRPSASETYVTDDDDLFAVLARRVTNEVIGGRLVKYTQPTLRPSDGEFTTLAILHACCETIVKYSFPPKMVEAAKRQDFSNEIEEACQHAVLTVWNRLLAEIEVFRDATGDRSEQGDARRKEVRRHNLLGRPVSPGVPRLRVSGAHTGRNQDAVEGRVQAPERLAMGDNGGKRRRRVAGRPVVGRHRREDHHQEPTHHLADHCLHGRRRPQFRRGRCAPNGLSSPVCRGREGQQGTASARRLVRLRDAVPFRSIQGTCDTRVNGPPIAGTPLRHRRLDGNGALPWMKRRLPMDYRRVSRHFRAAGLAKPCGPIALMILAGLTLPEAVGTCSLRGGYRGYRGGTSTAKAIRSLDLTLSRIPIPEACRHHPNQLRGIAPLLADEGYGKGKYLVLSRRRKSSHRKVRHASAVIDGRLLDWTIKSCKQFRIRAIYRIQGDLDAAKSKARRFAATIRRSQQPLARKPLAEFCRLFTSYHGLAQHIQLQFHYRNGRKKRDDTMIEWYPLKLHRQRRATPDSTVRALLASVHASLRSDLAALTTCLTDRHGARVHGNTRIKTLTRKQPRGPASRRRTAECATVP